MKLIVRQLSGLGNQLFQYAAGVYYAAQCSAQVQLISDSPELAHSHGHPRPFLLSHFSITAPHRQINSADRLVLTIDRRRVKPLFGTMLQNMLRVQVITESLVQRFRFQAKLPLHCGLRAAYLLGYWQVHDIADSMSADLRREFAFRAPPTGRNLDILRTIQNTKNPVSVHIRRGDYTLESEGNVALSMDYYARAMAQMKSSLDDPTFFVFSDDFKFAREHFAKETSAVFVDHNDAFSAHEDLRLMASCRHHIIANSTFSWWGAWLNRHTDKIVIAPRHWRVANCPVENDLIPPAWRLLD